MCKRIEKEAALDRFTKNSQGVIRDRQTGLEWYEGPDEDTIWDEAKRWVENLTVDGGGWRMPNLEELKGLYDEDAGGGISGNMASCFENMDGWYVWPGETDGWYVWSRETHSSSMAWFFDFNDGEECLYFRDGPDTTRAFAVRSRSD